MLLGEYTEQVDIKKCARIKRKIGVYINCKLLLIESIHFLQWI